MTHCTYCKANDPVLLGNCTFCNAVLHVECYSEHGRCPSCNRGDARVPPDPYAVGALYVVGYLCVGVGGVATIFAFIAFVVMMLVI